MQETIIDVSPTGEHIYYDQTGNAMVNRGGQWVLTPEYNKVPAQVTQPAPAPTYQQAPVYQQAPAPAGTPAQAPAQQANTMLAFFTGNVGADTSQLPAYMLQAEATSMDGQDQTMVDSIRLDKRGDLVLSMSGVALPPSRTLDVVILGCGPTGGRNTVYRTYYEGDYNGEADAEAKKPACWSYDNVMPAPNATKRQGVNCETCPMNIKGSGPNNTRKCGKAQYLMVALASDLSKAYRIKVSSKGIYAVDVSKNEYGLKPYATLLKSRNANWEGMVTRLECPDGLSGGLRFTPVRFLTETEYHQTQELKMKLDISLYINLDADQASVVLDGNTVAQVPAAHAVQVAQNIQQAVVQAAQAPVTQAVQPLLQPTPAPAQVAPAQVAPAPAPMSMRDQWQQHQAWATVPQNVRDYVLHPQVPEQTAHDYLAQTFPAVLAPVPPVEVPAAPAAPVAVAPVAPVQPTPVQPAPQVVPQPAQPGQPAPAQVAQPAPGSAPVEAPMPAAPVEPTAPAEPTAAPQPAPVANAAVGTIQAQNINDLLSRI